MEIGKVFDNRYKVIEKLGEGGMGEIYKATDQVLEKEVAIKTLLPQALSDKRATTQFKKELRLSQELRHENIAAAYDLKVSEERPFIVMEFVKGETLSNYLFNQPNHRVDEDTFIRIANQILDGMEHAHKKGVVHRDLKSGNIMVTDEGEVKIMDFGIAASLKETYSKSTGSPITISIHYASPEQINGEAPSPSMDIYSLGCVFYEMLDGEPPFRKGDILHQQLTKKPEPIKNISPHFNSVILKCLEKKKEDRFRNIDELKLALKGEMTDVTRKVYRIKLKKPQPIHKKKQIPMYMKLIVVFLVIALGVAGYLLIDFVFMLEKAKPVEAGGTKLPPEPPESIGVDISTIKKTAKERERIKSKWDSWQTGMKSDFMEFEKLDKSTAYTNQERETAWRLFLDNYKTDNPYSREDEQLRQRATQRIKELTEPEVKVQARVSLRSSAQSLSWNEGKSMVKRKNFYDSYHNKSGDFANEYESKTINGDKVVLDHATGLMWHQSGSEKYIQYDKSKQWVNELNRRGYAGYSDWRLPTLEEGASLIERTKMNGNLYIDPKFSAKQRYIRTSDMGTLYPDLVWVILFYDGHVSWINVDYYVYVRPVRSMK